MKYKIYCINLFEREDRYIHMKNEFKKYKLDVCFIRNNKHKLGGRYGCFSSHIQCIKDAKKNNLDFCLIFEDDVKLLDGCNKIIKECFDYIKKQKNAEILYCSCKPMYLSELCINNIYKGKSMGANTIFLTKLGMNKILKNYKNYIKNIHYDLFLYIILKESYYNIEKICNILAQGSNNDVWGTSFLDYIAQK